jgi:uridylate kinase
MIAWKGADSMNYRRVMLKLSGEALAGSGGKGYDEAVVRGVARQVKVSVDAGVQVGIVTGGGNYWRGRTSEAIARTKADQIGMLATIMNCIYVSEIFRAEGMKTAILSPFVCGTMTELFSVDLANRYFKEGAVVFFAGGTGHPYFSTDTGIALRAVEVGADAILLAKSIDGVYTADPKVDPAAKRYDTITMQEMIDKKLAVIDLTASVLCMENHVPLAIFDLNEENSIANAMQGKINGTIVTVE